jgi:hypothetical protein
MPILQGKGMYLWRINNVEGGDPTAIAEAARLAGLTHVLVKVADGRGTYNTYKVENGRELFNAQDGVDQVPAVIAALRARGIQAWGWQYIYGHYPSIEARMAIQRVREFNLDGFVVNAEIEFQETGMDIPAAQYMRELRTALPNTPIALSSFRYPNLHRPFPWETFLEYCDLNMPQVYWVGANNPGAQLVRSMREFQTLRVQRPYFPTGAAYGEHGWRATPEQVTWFLQAVKEQQLPGANFWEWYFARQKDSQLWNPVKNFAWGNTHPEKPVDIAVRYIEALNSNDPVRVASLYGTSGVHVTAQRTVQGSTPILSWYNQLFGQTLPNARFTITGTQQEENIRTVTWTAESSTGRVLDGKDSLGVKDERIAYHYTYFTVQEN